MPSDGSMAKKSWFSLVKKFFVSDTYTNQYKKQRRRRWFLGKFKIKRLPSISAASPSRETKVSEAEVAQSKQDCNVASFTDATPDEIAADVFEQPSSTPQYTYHSEDEAQEFSSINFQYIAPPSTPQWGREIQELAATRIQTAFRGCLARKALWALKGIVRLQAIIRGVLVRRQAITTLNQLQSVVNIQSQVCAKRSQMVDNISCSQGNKEPVEFKGKDIKIDLKSQRRWDDSLLTKEEENALCSSKRMAAIKRERIKEYTFSNRRSAELEQNKIDGRWRYWLEQWVDTRLSNREDLQNLVSVFSTRGRNKDDEPGVKQVRSRNLHKQCHSEESELPTRRSIHHRKQRSTGDGYSTGGGSPIIPTYMAATESAKAKSRSLSSPRLRPMSFDSNSETYSPYKHKLSPISSINSEVTTISMLTNPTSGFSHRSPGFKGPIKSYRSPKYLTVD